MTKKTRLIILCIYAVIFSIVTPYILLYSLGYRVDFAKRKIVATGGIYIRALPQGVDTIIDSRINNKAGIFSNSIFVQNLLPKQHSVLIKKDGYYDYQKNLLVKENEVTKLERVILVKQKIPFTLLKSDIDYFSVAPDGNKLLLAKIDSKKIDFEIINLINQPFGSDQDKLNQNFSLLIPKGKISDLKWSDNSNNALLNISNSYFTLNLFSEKPQIAPMAFLNGTKEVFFNPRLGASASQRTVETGQNSEEVFFIKNKNLYLNQQNIPIIKNVITYQIINQNITWLSYDGFLYNSNITSKLNDKINSQAFPIKQNTSYKIMIFPEMAFLQENESLFLLNKNSQIFEKFYSPVKNLKISPDGKKMLYYNNHEILLSLLDLNDPRIVKNFSETGSPDLNKIVLNKFSEQINDCYWLNDDYLILNLENRIIISEIDNRGNINTVELPQILFLNDGTSIDIKKYLPDGKQAKIFLNQQDKKLYILAQNNLLSSEKLVP